VRSVMVRANGLDFGVLEAGSGPLALCLHGFPDTAHTWEHLLPALAGAGFHAVAPFMRGYAPTAVPGDGAYDLGALAADAVGLHEVLGGDGDAVLIGHDWGAETAYVAASVAPGRWRRVVTLAVPPAALDPVLFGDYDQLRRFFYLFMFRDASGLAEAVVARDNMTFLDRLWRDWSPGYAPGQHLIRVKECLRQPGSLAAAIGYYRAAGSISPAGGSQETTGQSGGGGQVGAAQPPPTMYMHGADDGCIAVKLAREAERFLAPPSRIVVIEDAGHFLHLEKPGEVNSRILAWVAS
jgi:pimeloyl-ACP methyl ester carboxylesterase